MIILNQHHKKNQYDSIEEDNMDEKQLTPFEKEVVGVIEEVKDLFLKKNRSYNSNENPMVNFGIGGLLLYGDASYVGRFEALKSYMTKHVANIYGHNITMPGIDESMRDIATYMIIGTVMKRMYDREAAAANAPQDPDRSPA